MEYKCPSCGAAMRWDFDAKRLACDYCGHTEPMREPVMVQDPKACPSCGAPLPEDGSTIAHVCPYCGNSITMTALISKSDIAGIIPIRATKKRMFQLLMQRYSDRLCLVPDIFAESHLREVQTEFLPYRVYDARGTVRYQGPLTTSEDYGDTTVVSHYMVDLEANVRFDGITVLASSRMPDEVSLALEPFRMGEAMPFAEGYLAGSECHLPDIAPECDYGRIGDSAISSAWTALEEPASDACGHTPPSDMGNLKKAQKSIDAEPRGVFLLPVYQYTYRMSDGTELTYYLNAQTEEIYGSAPIDGRRVLLAAVALAFAAASVVTLVLSVLMALGD